MNIDDYRELSRHFPICHLTLRHRINDAIRHGNLLDISILIALKLSNMLVLHQT